MLLYYHSFVVITRAVPHLEDSTCGSSLLKEVIYMLYSTLLDIFVPTNSSVIIFWILNLLDLIFTFTAFALVLDRLHYRCIHNIYSFESDSFPRFPPKVFASTTPVHCFTVKYYDITIFSPDESNSQVLLTPKSDPLCYCWHTEVRLYNIVDIMELKFYDIVDTVELHYMVLLNCGVRLYGVVHTVTIECCWYRGET